MKLKKSNQSEPPQDFEINVSVKIESVLLIS